MRYQPAIQTSRPETLDGLVRGQWINYEGALGRYIGRRNGTIWIAWGKSGSKRFSIFVEAFKRGK